MGFDNKARNASNMKFYNRQLILNLVRKGPVSRAEVARSTGLTRAAVSIIIDGLVNEGLVLETGTGEAEYGRKPILLEINPDACYTVGLDISRNGCISGIVDLKGGILARSDFQWQDCKNISDAINIITEHVERQINELKIPWAKVLGMGISAPGPLDIFSGTILNPPGFDLWKDVKVVELLMESLPFPIYLDNNSNTLAQAEKNYGAAKGFGSFMLMVVDTGIGAGIIIDNRVYRGVGGFGSEIGHTTVDLNGEPCKCGNIGCIEMYASMPAIIQYAGCKDKSLISWTAIVDGAIAGDGVCTEIIDREASYLAAGIVNTMNLLELEAVILTGDILYKPEMLIGKIREILDKRSITRGYHSIEIRSSNILCNAQIISAAGIVMEKFFSPTFSAGNP